MAGNDNRPTASVIKHVVVAVNTVSGVERHPYKPAGCCTGEEVLCADRVVFEHTNTVARMQTNLEKCIRHSDTSLPRLSETEVL
jgi:hypothetical protein